MDRDYLFSRASLSDVLRSQKEALKREIEEQDGNYLLNVSEDDLCQYYVSKYSLSAPSIDENNIHAEGPKEVKIDVSRDPMRHIRDRSRPVYLTGVQITICIPFEGDAELLYCQPSTYTLNPPRAKVVNNEIKIAYESLEHDADRIKHEYLQVIQRIKEYLETIRKDVEPFNRELESFIREIVKARKTKLLNDQGLVAALGIPVRRRENSTTTYAVPSIKKKVTISRPVAASTPYKPEPTLPVNEYEDILSVLNNMALSMERSPQTFSKLQEEEIRDHFLISLNGLYEGQATGETFNFGGKTDILIR